MVALAIILFFLLENVLSRNSEDFYWGTSTSAYQIEGGVESRGDCIWDDFCSIPNHCNDTAEIAVNSYELYEQDLDLVQDLGVDFYRFSISWPRIFPTKDYTKPHEEGVKYYNNIIDGCIKRGVKPFVTLYHWDHPVYIDWVDDEIVEYFGEYARTCFKLFGDRVKYWLTLNEPWTYAVNGYGSGANAPGRCSDRKKCAEGNTATESYIVAHNSLLAHAKAYRIYEKEFRKEQNGFVGLTLNFDWSEEYSDKPEDIAAAERNREFKISWFADPIHIGEYPKSMQEFVGDRLPKFNESQKKELVGSWDFFGMNHYTTQLVYYKDNEGKGWQDDQKFVQTYFDKDGKPIGEKAESDWLYVVPWGIRKALNWVSERYNGPEIWITENGVDVPKETEKKYPEILKDDFRIDFYNKYIEHVMKARDEDNVNIKAYFCWSLLDNFEWLDGYNKKFGIVYVDREDNMKRYKKNSFLFLEDLFKN